MLGVGSRVDFPRRRAGPLAFWGVLVVDNAMARISYCLGGEVRYRHSRSRSRWRGASILAAPLLAEREAAGEKVCMSARSSSWCRLACRRLDALEGRRRLWT